ncbi:conjugative relaxase [Geobacter sp. FeAm09]|uniref:MobF family relaxase n=1 Tax=Geobacter sp. FeAm09 TaxID=2597769 RepID=UPI0011EE644E|nr:MobF family relaxase [Geobacter sp. FeAm09]QEM69507.1 conjugative relaxase [Geobacter sp. FeAm09]
MTSVSPPMPAAAAGKYFTAADYYTKDPGVWFGKGAAALGLEGKEITKEDFTAIAQGKTPDGRVLVRDSTHQDAEHRACIDLTFAPDKSVSVLALGDERIQDAMMESAKHVMGLLEREFAQIRIYDENGNRVAIDTGNIVAGLIQHMTNRDGDLHYHIHAALMNMSMKPGETEQWRALHNDVVYKNQMYLGVSFNSDFSKRLSELGYQINITDPRTGSFEIVGVNKELTADFSHRREEIEAKVAEYNAAGLYQNVNSAERHQMACNETKSQKQETTAEALFADWEQRFTEHGTTVRGEVDNALREGMERQGPMLPASEYIRLAAASLEQNESAYTTQSILHTAERLCIGQHGPDDLRAAIAAAQVDGTLMRINDKDGEKAQWATPQMIETEKRIYDRIRDTAQAREQIMDYAAATQLVADRQSARAANGEKTLSENQQDFVARALSSTASVVLVQGYSGAGKTFAAKELADILRDQHGFTIRAFGPTAAAKSELGKSLGVEAQTIDKFLLQPPSPGEYNTGREAWFVDETSMVGSYKFARLVEQAAAAGAVVYPIGDRNQLQAVEAGRLFDELQQQGVTETLYLSDIQRQRGDTPETAYMREAAGKIRDITQARAALEIVEAQGQVREIESKPDRLTVMAADYVSRDPSKTMLIVQGNAERHSLNAAIHEDLHAQGRLGEEEYNLTVRENKSLDSAQRHFAASYQIGDIIMNSQSGAGMAAGYEGRVTGVDAENNTITLTGRDGKERIIDPMQAADQLTVWREHQITASVGDKIVFLKNDEGERGIGSVNGDTAVISHIDENGWITAVRDRDGAELSWNIGQYANFDLGHALTSYKSQGQSIEHVIVSADSKMENYNDFYVALTRGKEGVTIYTDDIERLKDRIGEEQEKTSTLLFSLANEGREQAQDLNLPTTQDLAIRDPDRNIEDIAITAERVFEADKPEREHEGMGMSI